MHNNRVRLVPTPHQTFEITGFDFAAALERSYRLQSEGDVHGACTLRYDSFRHIVDTLPDDDEVVLEWEHRNSRAAIETVQASAVDHFLLGDLEMATAMLEMLLDVDPEDHTGSVVLLAFCYVATDEYELFDSLLTDIAEGAAARHILLAWSSFRRTGTIDPDELALLRERYGCWVEEFCADEHAADAEYMSSLESERPSSRMQARRLWLQTENLWLGNRDFIDELRRKR